MKQRTIRAILLIGLLLFAPGFTLVAQAQSAAGSGFPPGQWPGYISVVFDKVRAGILHSSGKLSP